MAVGLWLLFDPRRNFLLHLVHFTQGDPLLRISVYIFVGIGGICVLVGIFGCCAAVKEVRCLLCSVSCWFKAEIGMAK